MSARANAGYDGLDRYFFDDLEDEDLDELDVLDEEYEPDREADDPGPFCERCDCSQLNACPGGCVWATESCCSRCI